MFLDLDMFIDISCQGLIYIIIVGSKCDKRLLDTFIVRNESLSVFLYYQWKILMVMRFDADGLSIPRESVLVSVE